MTDTEAASTTQTAAVAEQGADLAPEKASSKKDASRKKNAPKGQRSTKGAKAKAAAKRAVPNAQNAKKQTAVKKTAAPAAGAARDGSKKSIILGLLRRKDGATLAEIAEASGWQAHSIRGFISGALGKKMGVAVESSKNAAGERFYRLPK